MITLNGTAIPEQPNTLDETPTFVKTDTSAIDGSVQRLQYPSKAKAVLTITNAAPATLAFIKALYDAAEAVTYKNTESAYGTLTFTGILSYSGGTYLRGGSFRTPLTITIEEGQPVGVE